MRKAAIFHGIPNGREKGRHRGGRAGHSQRPGPDSPSRTPPQAQPLRNRLRTPGLRAPQGQAGPWGQPGAGAWRGGARLRLPAVPLLLPAAHRELCPPETIGQPRSCRFGSCSPSATAASGSLPSLTPSGGTGWGELRFQRRDHLQTNAQAPPEWPTLFSCHWHRSGVREGPTTRSCQGRTLW